MSRAILRTPANPSDRLLPQSACDLALIAACSQPTTNGMEIDRVRKIALGIVPGCSASQAILHTLRSFDHGPQNSEGPWLAPGPLDGEGGAGSPH